MAQGTSTRQVEPKLERIQSFLRIHLRLTQEIGRSPVCLDSALHWPAPRIKRIIRFSSISSSTACQETQPKHKPHWEKLAKSRLKLPCKVDPSLWIQWGPKLVAKCPQGAFVRNCSTHLVRGPASIHPWKSLSVCFPPKVAFSNHTRVNFLSSLLAWLLAWLCPVLPEHAWTPSQSKAKISFHQCPSRFGGLNDPKRVCQTSAPSHAKCKALQDHCLWTCVASLCAPCVLDSSSHGWLMWPGLTRC